MIGVGILFDNKKRLPLNVAVAMARREFAAAVHTRGETPRVVVFHPDQAPEEAVIGGLTVYTDRDVPLNRIRVCTGVDLAERELSTANGQSSIVNKGQAA